MMENFSWLSDQGYRVLIDHLQDGIFVIEDEKIAYANQRLGEMLGYQINELIGRPFIKLISADDLPLALERHRVRLSGKNAAEQYELHLSTANGAVICCAVNVGLTENQKGLTVTVGSVRDVTQQKAALAELEASKAELKSIFDQLPDIFYRTNMQGVITMTTPACFDILGYRQEEMLGTPLSLYYRSPEDRQRVVQAIADGGGKATQSEAALRHKNGSIVWMSTNAFVCYGPDGQPIHVDGIARDISERKRMEDQLTDLARIDSLTGAYSRRYFMDKSEEVIKIMRRYQRPVSMMMADLDYFKKINDTYGHHAGDMALVAFTDTCRQAIRESDVLGRLGGEEFGLILPETPIQQAQILAERIRLATAATEIPLDDHRIGLTVSIGLVELSADENSINSVMRRADMAMYQAKERGRNQVVVS